MMTRVEASPPAALLADLRPFRCPRCDTLLARIRLTPGSVVEIKCGRCKALVKEAA